MELDLLTVERIERYIVFESKVWLNGWIDTSSHGFKVSLGLKSRAELDYFDGTMKRRKRKGGQRYHMILTPVAGVVSMVAFPEGVMQHESQFVGRGWNETKGAHIALHIPGLTNQIWWRTQKTRDQEGECSTWNIILMEIGDDEQIIDQTARERAERPVGGPRSKHVARMLQDPEFAHWMDQVSVHSDYGDLGPCDRTLEQRDGMMKAKCGITSKVEFDNGNEKAWEIWETQFKAPFIRHSSR